MSFKKDPRALAGHILLTLCCFAWGATFVVIKDALADASPLTFNAVRMSIAAVVLAVIFWKQLATISAACFRASFAIGLSMWLGYECQTAGLKYTAASKSAFLTGMSVVLVPLFLALFWKRHFNRFIVAGVICAFCGLYLMTVPGIGAAAFASINRGDVLTFFGAVAFAFQIIYVGRAAQHFSFGQIVTLEIAICAALMWISVLLSNFGPASTRTLFGADSRGEFIRWTPRMIVAIAVTSLICTVAAFIIQTWAQQFTPPTHTALIFSLEPVFGAATSYVVLHERLGWMGSFGALLILAGVLISEVIGSEAEKQELREETA